MLFIIVFHLNKQFLSFSKIVIDLFIRAANLGGDADTVAAIVGMLAGAYYGLSQDLLQLY